MVGGLRAAMGYVGAADLSQFRERARFIRITGARGLGRATSTT
jgi:IMP dehydrogenase